MPEAYYYSLDWQVKALAYRGVMEDAKPGLEQIAAQRARQRITANQMAQQNKQH